MQSTITNHGTTRGRGRIASEEGLAERTTVFLGRASFRMISTGKARQERSDPLVRSKGGTTRTLSPDWFRPSEESIVLLPPSSVQGSQQAGEMDPISDGAEDAIDEGRIPRRYVISLGILAVLILGTSVIWVAQTATHSPSRTAPAAVSKSVVAPSPPVVASPPISAPSTAVSPAATVPTAETQPPDNHVPRLTTRFSGTYPRKPSSIARSTVAAPAKPTRPRAAVSRVDPLEARALTPKTSPPTSATLATSSTTKATTKKSTAAGTRPHRHAANKTTWVDPFDN